MYLAYTNSNHSQVTYSTWLCHTISLINWPLPIYKTHTHTSQTKQIPGTPPERSEQPHRQRRQPGHHQRSRFGVVVAGCVVFRCLYPLYEYSECVCVTIVVLVLSSVVPFTTFTTYTICTYVWCGMCICAPLPHLVSQHAEEHRDDADA